MKDKIKYHWNENIKPALVIMVVGALLIVGMRLMEIAWPEESSKVLICFTTDIGVTEQCDPFVR